MKHTLNIYRPDRKYRFIRSLRLTYGVTFVAFRDLGVVVGVVVAAAAVVVVVGA